MLFTILGWILFGLDRGLHRPCHGAGQGRHRHPGARSCWASWGSFVGGLIFGLFTGGLRGFEPSGWIGSIIGAVIVLVIYNKVTGRKRIGR